MTPTRTYREPPPILTVRTRKVVLDQGLATLYGVTTGQLNQALKRNRRRFPTDFAFQLNAAEHRILKSQSVLTTIMETLETPPFR